MVIDRTVRVTERVFDLEDYSGTQKSLKNMNQQLYELDQDFRKLFRNLMVEDDQKGKIIDRLDESASELKRQNLGLIHEVDERIEEVITELTQKVNGMNQFTMSITYYEDAPAT